MGKRTVDPTDNAEVRQQCLDQAYAMFVTVAEQELAGITDTPLLTTQHRRGKRSELHWVTALSGTKQTERGRPAMRKATQLKWLAVSFGEAAVPTIDTVSKVNAEASEELTA